MHRLSIIILSALVLLVGIVSGISLWQRFLPSQAPTTEKEPAVSAPEAQSNAQEIIEDFRQRRTEILKGGTEEDIEGKELYIPQESESPFLEDEEAAEAPFGVVGSENEPLKSQATREVWEKLPHVATLPEEVKKEYFEALGLANEDAESFSFESSFKEGGK